MNERKSFKRKLLTLTKRLFKFRPLEIILVSLSRNIDYGRFITKLIPEPKYYKRGSIRQVKRNGITYQLDISDMVDWYIYFGFKQRGLQELFNHIKPGFNVIDVGSNVGLVTLNAAKLISNKGVVHSFEPDPFNFDRLISNIELNQFKNINPNKLGLGDYPGEFSLGTVNEYNLGMNRILSRDDLDPQAQKIQVTTLDLFLSEKGLHKIEVIKIDVEGFEMKVLRGASQCIEKYHPTLFIEIDDKYLKDQGDSARELVSFIEDYGYLIKNCDSNETISSENDFSNCHFDILCTYIKD